MLAKTCHDAVFQGSPGRALAHTTSSELHVGTHSNDVFDNGLMVASDAPSPVSISVPSSLTKPRVAKPEPTAFLEKSRMAAGRRANPINRQSHHRGVTHHGRTSRYEAHIWDQGKQVYCGGYYNVEQASLAYDLAAVRMRGEEASTNADVRLFDGEMAERHRYTKDQIVNSLRAQSKAMNKVESGQCLVSMQPWELQLSALIQPSKVHAGVYATEAEAARGFDRMLVQALGIDAEQLLNFRLLDYIDLLTPAQVLAGVAQGLLPAEIPADFALPSSPEAVFKLDSAVTRSLLEFDENDAVNDPAQQPSAKRQKCDQELQSWINELLMD